jgi:hypothetical protein
MFCIPYQWLTIKLRTPCIQTSTLFFVCDCHTTPNASFSQVSLGNCHGFGVKGPSRLSARYYPLQYDAFDSPGEREEAQGREEDL